MPGRAGTPLRHRDHHRRRGYRPHAVSVQDPDSALRPDAHTDLDGCETLAADGPARTLHPAAIRLGDGMDARALEFVSPMAGCRGEIECAHW